MISIETRQLSSMEGTAIDREAVCFLPYVFFFLKEKKGLERHTGDLLLCFVFFSSSAVMEIMETGTKIVFLVRYL